MSDIPGMYVDWVCGAMRSGRWQRRQPVSRRRKGVYIIWQR